MKNTLIIYLTFILCFTQFGDLLAQSITGKVVTEDNAPLEFVSVKLLKDSTILQYVASDNSGRFTLKAVPTKRNYKLELSFTGYETVDTTVSVQTGRDILIKMKKDITKLDEVVVQGSRPLIERKVDRLVFNVQNSSVSLSGDAMDVLRVTPLVKAENGVLSIIGKGTVSVMVNDKILRMSGEDLSAYLRSIPSNNIESIEVITVPPSKYSSEGNAGMLNIKLKKLVNDYWSASVRSVYTQGTYATISPGIGFNYQKNRLSLYTNANMTNGSSSFTERPEVHYATQKWISESKRRSYTKLYNARIQADYKMSEKLTVGAQVSYNNSRPKAPDRSSTHIFSNETGKLDSMIVGWGTQESERNNVSLNLNSSYSLGKEGQRIVLDIDYYNSTLKDNRGFNSGTQNANGQLITDREWFSGNMGNNSFRNTSVNLDVEQKIKQFIVNYGLNYSNSTNSNLLSSTAIASRTDTVFNYDDNFEFTENTGALFLSVSRSLGKKLEMKGGLRMENTNAEGISNTLLSKYVNSYLKLFPTFYSSYKLNDKNVISLSYGKRISRPAYLRLNPFRRYITQYFYTVGNPYLKPSFSHNIELNYSNNRNLYLTLYTNIGKDQITSISIPHESTKLVIDTAQNFLNTITAGFTAVYNFNKLSWLESNLVLNGYHTSINQKDNSIVADSKAFIGYINMYNNFKISKKISAQLSFFYYTPEISGLYRRTATFNLYPSFRYKINDHWDTAIFGNDLLKTTQGKLSGVVNGVYQSYDNYYDSRNVRLSVSYRFGSMKVNVKQRDFKNEKEKQRAY